MKKQQIIVTSIALLSVIVAALFFSSAFSTAQTQTMSDWHFVTGCHRDKCYSTSYDIGDIRFSSVAPVYDKKNPLCQFYVKNNTYNSTGAITKSEHKYVDVPAPNPVCWSETLIMNDGNKKTIFTFRPFETIKINKYIEVTWTPQARIYKGTLSQTVHKSDGTSYKRYYDVDYDYDPENVFWVNDFTFHVYDTSFLQTSISDKHISSTIGESDFVTYNIYNDLTNLDGGSLVRESFRLWAPANIEKIDLFKVYKGNKTYRTTINTETLGDQSIVIASFIKVNDVRYDIIKEIILFANQDEKELRTIANIENIPSQDQFFWDANVMTTTDDVDRYIYTGSNTDIKNTVIIVLILIIVALGILYFKVKR